MNAAAHVAGTRDPEVLADLALGKLRPKIPQLREAREGRFGAHHAAAVLNGIDPTSRRAGISLPRWRFLSPMKEDDGVEPERNRRPRISRRRTPELRPLVGRDYAGFTDGTGHHLVLPA
ncbi:MAG TPA: hypothetical protein VFI47_26200 [Acidimicrobiales bacterium]|nr:hypothetical protein [Acidimicrobiales bacterium]